MTTRIRLPKINTNIEEETVTRWLKKTGDLVRKGEPLVELTTEKASFDFESPVSGTLLAVLAGEKSVLPVGTIIAIVGKPSEPIPDVSAANKRLLAKHRAIASTRKPVAPPPEPAARSEVRATPSARRLARERNVDLAELAKTVPGEVIREAAVFAYLERRTS